MTNLNRKILPRIRIRNPILQYKRNTISGLSVRERLNCNTLTNLSNRLSTVNAEDDVNERLTTSPCQTSTRNVRNSDFCVQIGRINCRNQIMGNVIKTVATTYAASIKDTPYVNLRVTRGDNLRYLNERNITSILRKTRLRTRKDRAINDRSTMSRYLYTRALAAPNDRYL